MLFTLIKAIYVAPLFNRKQVLLIHDLYTKLEPYKLTTKKAGVNKYLH